MREELIKNRYRRVRAVGVELEGGWMEPMPPMLHRDISVKNGEDGFPPLVTKDRKHVTYTGEVATPPGGVSLKQAINFIKVYHPAAVNHSCGMHVHVSVHRVSDYSKLMKKSLWVKFIEEAARWGEEEKLPNNHPFWSRLSGENRFAAKEFRPGSQIAITNKERGPMGRNTRRTILNFCFAMHGTIECRLFPGWETPELAISATIFFTNFIEDFLLENTKRKVKQRSGYISLTRKRLEEIVKSQPSQRPKQARAQRYAEQSSRELPRPAPRSMSYAGQSSEAYERYVIGPQLRENF